jgi:hypothetical protein
MMRTIVRGGAAAFALVIAAAFAADDARAQNRGANCPGFQPYENPLYDGRLSFVRIRYNSNLGGGRFERRGGGRNAGWLHDYPTAECHFTRLLVELTTLRARTSESHILALDDPELFRHPVAYMSEPGYWYPSEAEVLGLRNYLKKGGFIIFDDFEGQHIYNLAEQMNRVLPDMRLYRIDEHHAIFDAFYRVKSIEMYHPQERTPSTFYAIFEDNDPRKRMLAIANHNNDIGDYWEWSDTGLYGIDPSNEAYKLGINYIIYVLSR